MTLKNTVPTVVIHCQYVYGIGHFVRTVELAKGLSSIFNVWILSGGEQILNFEVSPSINLIQLPAIYKKETDEYLRPVGTSHSLEQCFQCRDEIITQTIETLKPDILITEHFPFGLLFEKEVISLIKKVKLSNPNAKIVSSVRDILESEKGSKKDIYVSELLNNWYHMVLVHGDERFASLALSFSEYEKIKIPVTHTGYVVRTLPTIQNNENCPIILASVAGGRLGNELLDALVDTHTTLDWNEEVRRTIQ